MGALVAHSWPGNIRELQNLIERAVILSNDGVLFNPLPAADTQMAIAPLPVMAPRDQAATSVKGPAMTTLKDAERALILHTLNAAGWIVGGPKGAAARLGLKRPTLIHKMKRLGISRPADNDDLSAPSAQGAGPLP
jgi:transcriptional regulator of acetoin/glycerol metabolism